MNQWMQIAYDEAVRGMLADEGGPFGAAVVKDGVVIASAHNEVLKTNDPTAHAEINAIRHASEALGRFDLGDCVLYTTCRPCPMCLGAILWARISKVYYGASDEDAARGGFDDRAFYEAVRSPEQALPTERIDAEACASLFDRWNEKTDRRLY